MPEEFEVAPAVRLSVDPLPGWNPVFNPTQDLIFNDVAEFILSYGEKGCRTSDAMIYTSAGLKRLGRLKPEGSQKGKFTPIDQGVISFDDGKVIRSRADGFWVEPKDDAIKVTLANGAEITGSDRHPLWTCWQGTGGKHGFGYKSFEQMKGGKSKGFRYWTPLLGHPEIKGECQFVCGFKITENIAYSIGALVGDGSMNLERNPDMSIGFTNQDAECLDAVRVGLAEVGCWLSLNKGDTYQYCVRGPALRIRPIIRELEIGKLSYFKRIPNQILESPESVICAFLRGLFDTDGTAEKNGLVSLCTVSEKLSRDVQDVLACLGILCVRRPKKSASGNPTWTLSMMGKQAMIFGQKIGFNIARKQERICKPKVSIKVPNGFNRNLYGYPDPIRSKLKSIALASRTDARKPKPGVLHRDRKWHNDNRRFHSFGSIPNIEKVLGFCDIYDCKNSLSEFLISDTWLEVVSAEDTKAELFDLHVPGPHSFLASGTINHNSGKTWGALNALVRHCYEEKDALALIIAVNIRSGKEGTIYDLERVLDTWRNGNLDRDGNRLDSGMGESFEFTAPKLDPQTKDRHIYIGNRHGGWSKVVLMSIPYAEVVEARIRSLSPSFVFMEEITLMSSEDYFTYVAAQLARRPGIIGPQQFYAACNPEGPSHWVYKRFWDKCIDEKSGKRSPKYSVYHVPIMENLGHLPPNYLDSLDEILKDPIVRARLLRGEWIDRPSGEAIFRSYYNEKIHRRGDVLRQQGIIPWSQWPMIVSYDPGPVNFSVHFMQQVPTKERPVWLVFDELNFVGKRMPYFMVVPKILGRMDFWSKKIGSTSRFIHIAPSDAFNQLNHEGSYDATVIENLSRKAPGEPRRIRMRACPQAAQSVTSRVQMLISLLLEDCMIISALCTKTHEMITNLESKKGDEDKYEPNRGLEPKRSVYLHPFDSLTYAPYYFSLHPAQFATQTGDVKSEIYGAGGR